MAFFTQFLVISEDMSKDSQSIEAPAAKRAFGKAASQPIKEEQPLPEISEGKTKGL